MGEGEEKEQLQKRIDHLQMNQFVHLLGFKNDVSSYIEKAKFLVLTSKYEGFPMVILEANAAGVPVISFDSPTGPRNIINHNQDGILVDYNNTDAFVSELIRFTSNTKLQETMSWNARENAKKYAINIIMNKWNDLIFKAND